MYRIRPATADDLPAIGRLHHRHEKPGEPLAGGPSDLQQTTWDRMMATPNLA